MLCFKILGQSVLGEVELYNTIDKESTIAMPSRGGKH